MSGAKTLDMVPRRRRPFNRYVLCVDDEQSVLDAYRQVLAPEDDLFGDILADENEDVDAAAEADGAPAAKYEVFFARSGEEAVELVERELAAGHHMTCGFFDMRMPGGIDGFETIRRVRALDSSVHCAVVTAYTDRQVSQIRTLFAENHQDELLYFKKPFTAEELEQTAYNMMCSWNRKRAEEEQLRVIEKNRTSLKYILGAVADLSTIPPRSVNNILSGILYHTLALTDAEDGYIAIVDEEMQFRAGCGLGQFAEQAVAEIWKEATCVRKVIAAQAPLGSKTCMEGATCVFPLAFGDRLLGVIYIESRHEVPVDQATEQEVLEIFRTQMVPLILNSLFYDELVRKERLVMTDPLTGLYNRRFIVKRLEEELSRLSREEAPIAILMIDLDNFKSINDTYGHELGDEVLRGVAEILLAAVRSYDIVGRNVDEGGGEATENGESFAIRYGGEEFTVILTNTGEEGALAASERIRHRIMDRRFSRDGFSFGVTASIGIGVGVVKSKLLREPDFITEIVREADRALYVAKSRGKNRTQLYEG